MIDAVDQETARRLKALGYPQDYPNEDHHPVVKPDGPGVRTRWYECACGGPWPCEKAKAKEEEKHA